MDNLSKAIALTDEILQVLDEEDFEKIAELELERRPLIEQSFNTTVEQIDQIKALHLQKLNQQVVDRLTELKQAVLQQQKQTRQASRAAREYSSNQQHRSGLLAASQQF